MADFESKSVEKRRKKKRKLRSYEESGRHTKASRIDYPGQSPPEEIEEEERREGKEEQTETDSAVRPGGPWRNLDLVLSLQNKEFDIQRKVELAFDFVKSRRNEEGDGVNRGPETVSISRLVVFLNDWIQSLLISPDKKITVEGKKPRSGVMEACLDFRSWEVLKFCLEESSNLEVSLSFSPYLLRALSCILRDALSILDSISLNVKESVFNGEGFELYDVFPKCVSLLLSYHGRAFNTNLDLWASTVSALLDLLHKIYYNNVEVGPHLLPVSCLVLEAFASFLRVHPSPKNVFPVFVDRLLEPLLSLLVLLHLQTKGSNPLWTRNLLKMVEDTLSNGLFHSVHLDGFLSTHGADRHIMSHDTKVRESKTAIRSYHRHFFHKVEHFMTEKKVLALGGLGELFRLFVVRVKKYKGAPVLSQDIELSWKSVVSRQSDNDDKSIGSKIFLGQRTPNSENIYLSNRLDTDTSQSLFDLFVQFMDPLLLTLKRCNQTDLEVALLPDAHCSLKSMNKILSGFMHEKVYVRTEDTSEGIHLSFFKEVYDTCISFSAKLNQFWFSVKDIGDRKHIEMLPSIAKELFVAVGYFLEIEYEVIRDNLVSLWLMMLSYSAFDLVAMDTLDRCELTRDIVKLGSQLVNVFSELRQVNDIIFSLCKAMRLCRFHDSNDQLHHLHLIFCLPLSHDAYAKSVAILVCSEELRFAITNALRLIPEGQASACIQQLKFDISESLEWFKVCCSGGGQSCCKKNFNLPYEILGRDLSEIYTLVLDSLTVTSGNSITVANSVKELVSVMRPNLSSLVAEQPCTASDFLFSVTERSWNRNLSEWKNDLPATELGSSWVFVFFFRLYISCRSLFRQSVSLMPPESSKKTSLVMGDSFTAYSGRDWIERIDWTEEGYFSWICKPSASLLTVIQSISDIYWQNSVAECGPLIYVLHAMALQRLIDLNRQIKSLEFLRDRSVRLAQMKLMNDNSLSLPQKESKKWKRHLAVLREEAVGLTSFMMGYLILISKELDIICNGLGAQPPHEHDVWDLGVSSVNMKSLPTAIWYIICQNTDIWCLHATKKQLKKFLSLLIYSSVTWVRCSFQDVGKYWMDKSHCLRKVNIPQISLELLSDSALYEQEFLCRHLASEYCRLLKKSILPIFGDSYIQNVDFKSLPDWSEAISKLDSVSVAVSSDKHYDFSSAAEPNNLQPYMMPRDCGEGEKASWLLRVHKICQNLLDFLCWLSKTYANSRFFSFCGTYILNIERLVVCSLLDYHGELYLQNRYELFRMFLSCRRALKYLLMASLEEKMEISEYSLTLRLSKNSQFVLWLLKSVSAVVGLQHAFSEDHADKVRAMIFSLIDHTGYIFLIFGKDQFNHAINSLVYDEKHCKALANLEAGDKKDNIIQYGPNFESAQGSWKIVVLLAETLEELTKSLLNSLKCILCNVKVGAGLRDVDLNKLSSTISGIQGFLWGLASVVTNINEKVYFVELKSLRWKIGPTSELSHCMDMFEGFITFCLQFFLVEDGQQQDSLCDVQSLQKLDFTNASFTLEESCESSLHNIEISSGERENLEGGKQSAPSGTDDDQKNNKNCGTTCTENDYFQKRRVHSNQIGCVATFLNEIEWFQLQNFNKPLLQSLLKGENCEVAFLLRQLFLASSATLRLNFQIGCISSTSRLMPTFVGISQFLLLELADTVEVPHSFSFVCLDGVIKYLEVLGSYISLTNPTLSRNVYAMLIDLHLKAIGKCISLQGKKATLASHETESSTKTLQGLDGLSELYYAREPYSLDEFKSRLRESFKAFTRQPLELHLLSAIQAIERALVGVQDGCTVVYEINMGSPDGGKVSSTVAAGVDCLDLVLESVSGRKRLNVVRRHIQSLISALFNIVLHLQGPVIFYGKLTFNKGDAAPDPGSVVLMCVEVLKKVAGKHAFFQMDSYHVGQSLCIPGALFQDFCQLCASKASSDHLIFSHNQNPKQVTDIIPYIIDQQFSVDLFAACCRLLCTVVRHHKFETQRCIALLEESVNVLLHCLEAADTDIVARNGYISWKIQEGVKCASFLQRIYEEIRQQKDVLGQCCFQFLSNYISIYSGYGPLRRGIRREIDEALRPGIYALIDVCSPDDLQQLHTVLGEGPCRSTLANLQHDYKLNFQYGGKV